jgi:hypothetical protein
MKEASHQATRYLDNALLEFKNKMKKEASLSELEALVEKLKRSYE